MTRQEAIAKAVRELTEEDWVSSWHEGVTTVLLNLITRAEAGEFREPGEKTKCQAS